MSKILIRGFLLIAVFFFPLQSFAEEVIRFQQLLTIYADDAEKSLLRPEGLDCTSASLIVADTGNNRLLKFALADGTPKGASEIKVPELTQPIRVQVNSKGEILVLDGKKRRIVRLNPAGQFIGYLDPKGLPSGPDIVLRSFKLDRQDNIYILDVFSGRVLILNPEGEYQKEISFPEEYGFFSDLAVAPGGGIFLIDSVESRVFSAPEGSKSFSPITGRVKDIMSFPTGITVDGKGLIYVVDQNGGSMVIFRQDGSFQGRRLAMGWREGLLYYPTQMCVNNDGDAFIADRNNNRIPVFR